MLKMIYIRPFVMQQQFNLQLAAINMLFEHNSRFENALQLRRIRQLMMLL